jgi:hypothetical protein
MKAIVGCCCAALLVGCAANSGVVPMGSDTYMISKQAATGFSGMGSLKADVMREAYAKCSSERKAVQVVESNESKPPYVLANYPRIDLTFRCVPPANNTGGG